MTPELETEIRDTLEGNSGSTAPCAYPQFYEHEHFDEDRFYNRGTDGTSEELEEGRKARVSRIMQRINGADNEIPGRDA